MKTHLSLLVLLAAVSSPAVSADIVSRPAADAQTQAATLLKAEIPPAPRVEGSPDIRLQRGARRASAQTQAAEVVRGPTSFSSLKSGQASVDRGWTRRAKIARTGARAPDAQSQAQGLLRAESARTRAAIGMKVSTASP